LQFSATGKQDIKTKSVSQKAYSVVRHEARVYQRPGRYLWILSFLVFCLSLSACDSDPVSDPASDPANGPVSDPVDNDQPMGETPGTPDTPEPVEVPIDPPTVFIPTDSDIQDNLSLYQQDGYGQTDVIRIDVITRTTRGICVPGNQSGCTLADVEADTNAGDDFKVDIPVHFRATDFANDGSINNAELRQRGGGARFAPQKSFRIKLDDKEQLWRGERHLQLNKHPFETSRVRNKLSFDLMSAIPHLPSFRTQFVNLWIDDGAGAVDYGLFTHVERGNGAYLQRRNLDEEGRLYKAEFFQFLETDRQAMRLNAEGEPDNEEAFEKVLEIENGDDHSNLLAMLGAIHDPAQSFQSVMDQYFNENNVLTWIAVNLLVGQQDALRHNYFLYNPEASERFYFLPWDYDSAFLTHKEPDNAFTEEALRARLEYGYAIGAQNEFVENYYRMPGAHERILAAAAQLREELLSDERIAERSQLLETVIAPFASAQPDRQHNAFYLEGVAEDFAGKVASNQQAMINNFGIPLPPTMAQPVLEAGKWKFSWKPAYDVTGSVLTYELQIATAPTFLPDEIALVTPQIADASELVVHTVDAARLTAGATHYARLIARSVNEPERYWQIADNQLLIGGNSYMGVVRLQ